MTECVSVPVCVCASVSVCVCVHVCLCVSVRAGVRLCFGRHVFVCVCLFVSGCVCVIACLCTYACASMSVCACVSLCVCFCVCQCVSAWVCVLHIDTMRVTPSGSCCSLASLSHANDSLQSPTQLRTCTVSSRQTVEMRVDRPRATCARCIASVHTSLSVDFDTSSASRAHAR